MLGLFGFLPIPTIGDPLPTYGLGQADRGGAPVVIAVAKEPTSVVVLSSRAEQVRLLSSAYRTVRVVT